MPRLLHALQESKLEFSHTVTAFNANSTSTIWITSNLFFHENTKRTEVDFHSIQNEYEKNTISIPHITSVIQLANPFTEAMTKDKHKSLVHY